MNTKLFKNKFMAIAAMFTIVLGVGAAIAMKAPDAKKAVATKKQTNSYWVYNGGTVTSESSYTLTSGNPCDGSTNICEISSTEDPSNPGHPSIGTALATRITNKDTSAGDVFLQD
jgi:hypothetical protein